MIEVDSKKFFNFTKKIFEDYYVDEFGIKYSLLVNILKENCKKFSPNASETKDLLKIFCFFYYITEWCYFEENEKEEYEKINLSTITNLKIDGKIIQIDHKNTIYHGFDTNQVFDLYTKQKIEF